MSACPDCEADVIKATDVSATPPTLILLDPEWLGEGKTADSTYEVSPCCQDHPDDFARRLDGFEAEARRDTYAKHECAVRRDDL